jgi:hypothetical protein
MSNTVLLEYSDVATRLPVQDLERPRLFYAEKLGLEPVEERPGGLFYRCGRGAFALFISSGASSGTHTDGMGGHGPPGDGKSPACARRGIRGI